MKHTINLFMENIVEAMLGERNNIYAVSYRACNDSWCKWEKVEMTLCIQLKTKGRSHCCSVTFISEEHHRSKF